MFHIFQICSSVIFQFYSLNPFFFTLSHPFLIFVKGMCHSGSLLYVSLFLNFLNNLIAGSQVSVSQDLVMGSLKNYKKIIPLTLLEIRIK